MSRQVEARFERYCELMTATMGHADRVRPGSWYLRGLVLPGERKSVEPMAARVHPSNVASAHQSMHHLVAVADWSDQLMLKAVCAEVLPELLWGSERCAWIIDDTGVPKKGRHSVGVARQYCGQTGKTDNCQVAVSLSIATDRGSLPVGYQLYLPEEWAEDRVRRRKAGVPEQVHFSTKGQIAMQLIESALEAGYIPGTVLADAAYGEHAAWRAQLSAYHLQYAVGIRKATAVWWGRHQPAAAPPHGARARARVLRDENHQPISVAELAAKLPEQSYHTVAWRQGVRQTLSSRFARVRACAANENIQRPEEWLIIEWPSAEAEPSHYWLSNLPEDIGWQELIDTLKGRFRIERDYLELKQELGLGHYEGRNWRGFHHHASLCIAAYGFLVMERLRGSKKNFIRLQEPQISEGFRPRGFASNAATRTMVGQHV